MTFRLRYQVLGGHTHVRVFAGEGQTLGKCGDLIFRNEEWEAFVHQLGRTTIRVLREGESVEKAIAPMHDRGHGDG